MDSNETPTTKVSLMKINLTEEQIVKGLKTGSKFVVRASVTTVVAGTLKKYAPVESKTDEVKVVIGAYVIGGVASDMAADWIDKTIDKRYETFKAIRRVVKGDLSEETTEE